MSDLKRQWWDANHPFSQPGYNEAWWQQAQTAYQMPPSYGQYFDQQIAASCAVANQIIAAMANAETDVSIEEQRKALKVGDRITSGDQLAVGMRIRVATMPHGYMVRARERHGWAVGPEGQWIADSSWGQPDSLAVYFVGWDPDFLGANEGEEVKAAPIVLAVKPDTAKTPTFSHDYAPAAKRPGGECAASFHQWYDGKAHPCGAPDCEYREPQPTPPPRALPFKPVPFLYVGCPEAKNHTGTTMCLTCEGIIAKETERLAKKDPPARPEPHYLAPSGMCGPILSRLR